MVIVATSMPPKSGSAMGTMTSEPRPVDVSTGISARMAVEAVMRAGLIRFIPASTVACLISDTE